MKYVNDMNEVERDYSQVQTLMPTNNQDCFADFWAIYNKIISIYQNMCGTPSVSTNPVSTNNRFIQLAPFLVASILLIGFNHYTIGAKGLKL